MAIQAHCPHCQAKFQVKDELKGKKIRCKECQDVFTVGDAIQQKVRAGSSPAKKTRLAPPIDEQDDDDDRRRPERGESKRRRDDDDDRPRKRRDDDEDRPQRKKPRDDEDDDRPRKKRREEDDDDRPRRKREDSVDDDRPSRRKKGKKGSSAGLIIGLAAGGVLLLGIGVVALIVVMSGDEKKQPAPGIQVKIDNKDIQIDFKDFKFPDGKNFPDMKNFPEVKFPNQPVKKRTGDDVVDKMEELKTPFARRAALIWYASNPLPNHPKRDAVSAMLLDMIKNPVPESIQVGQALAVWANKEAAPVLADLVMKKEGDCRRAIFVLGKLKDPVGFEPLAARLVDVQNDEQKEAERALDEIGAPAESAVIPYLFRDENNTGIAYRAGTILKKYGTKDEVILGAAVKELAGERKRGTAEYLVNAKVNDACRNEVAKGLEPLLQDPDKNVRAVGRRAFIKWADKEQVPQLFALLETAQGGEERDVLNILGKYKEERVAEGLAQRLVAGGQRSEIAKVLINMGAPLVEKHVIKLLHHPNSNLRFEAANILKAFNTSMNAKIDRTLEDMRSPDKDYRRNAVQWLIQTKPEPARQADVTKALNDLLNDNDVRQIAMVAIRQWGGTPAIGTPVTPVNPVNPNPPVGADIASLIKTVEMPGDMQARHKAMDALAQLKDPRGAEAVAKCLMFSPPDRSHAANTLKAMGPVAEGPACFALLNSPDSQVRIEASRVLAAIGTRNSLPVLQKATFADAKNKSHYLSAMKSISSR